MSQAQSFPSEFTILYAPAWYSSTAREESALPLAPGDYKVTPGHGADRWTVTSLKHTTKVDSIQEALSALGKRLDVGVA